MRNIIVNSCFLPVLLVTTICFFGCGGNKNPFEDPDLFPEPQIRMTISPEEGAKTGEKVTMDGSKTTHSYEESQVSYSWEFLTKPVGSNTEIVKTSDSKIACFTPDMEGTYRVLFKVLVQGGNDVEHGFTVPVREDRLRFDIGPDLLVDLAVPLQLGLTGDSFIPDPDSIEFAWTFIDLPFSSSYDKSPLPMLDNTKADIEISLDEQGVYTLELKGTDLRNLGSVVRDTVSITINPPVIYDFSPKIGGVGDTVLIVGKNFSSENFGVEVLFNTDKGHNISVSSDTIQVRVPSFAQTGRITVKIRNTQDEVITAEDFVIQIGDWGTVYTASATLAAMAFADSDIGIVVGSGGLILRTTDKGNSWSEVNSGTTRFLKGVDFASAQVGYACGFTGTVLKTVDGGLSWNPVSVNTTIDLDGISFANPDTGYVVGAWGKVFATYDGGSNWEEKSLGGITSILDAEFLTGASGILIGSQGKIWTTSDAGATYNTPSYPTLNFTILRDVAWGFSFWMVVGDIHDGEGTILRSTDDGESFSRIFSGVNQHFRAMDSWSGTHNLIVGDAGVILRSNDSGITWNTESSGTTENLLSVHMTSSEHAVIVAANSILLSQ